MHLWTDGERNHEWQESIAVFGPGQHPEQVLETKPALYLADLEGNVDEHNWVDGPPDDVSYRNKKIHIVNYRADYDPFTIGNFEGGNIYGGEITDYSVFPTWNHWPVAQMPSDGRYASFPDRTGHSSLTHVFMPTYKSAFGDRPYQEKVLMEGLSNKSAKELIPLAKSWLQPADPRLQPADPLKADGCRSAKYDRGQRAYILEATGSKISVTIKASEDSPIVNPCFVISNWDESEASLSINGEKIECGKDLRIGRPRTVVDKDLVIWVRYTSQDDTKFVIEAAD